MYLAIKYGIIIMISKLHSIIYNSYIRYNIHSKDGIKAVMDDMNPQNYTVHMDSEPTLTTIAKYA